MCQRQSFSRDGTGLGVLILKSDFCFVLKPQDLGCVFSPLQRHGTALHPVLKAQRRLAIQRRRRLTKQS